MSDSFGTGSFGEAGGPGYGQGPGGQGSINWAAILQALQDLVRATNAQAQYIKGNLGGAATGDITGTYPGPITVVSTHLNAPLPVAQGGTGNTTGAPEGSAGGDLGGTYPAPTVTGTHLSAPLPVAQGGTGLSSGTSGGIVAFSAAGSIVSSALLTQNALVLGGGVGLAPAPLGSLGTATTVLHGNASGGPAFGPIVTNDIAVSAVTYAKIQNESASTLLGNPTGGAVAPEEITLGATLAFSGTTLETDALTGDVTASANSFATTVGAIGGQTVSPASWTPIDASGAALVFTSVSANYTRLGNMVFAYGTVTYPATADGSAANIGGLPFNAANQPYANIPYVVRNSGGTFGTQGLVLSNTNTFTITDITTGAAKTNANMSGLVVRFMMGYPVI